MIYGDIIKELEEIQEQLDGLTRDAYYCYLVSHDYDPTTDSEYVNSSEDMDSFLELQDRLRWILFFKAEKPSDKELTNWMNTFISPEDELFDEYQTGLFNELLDNIAFYNNFYCVMPGNEIVVVYEDLIRYTEQHLYVPEYDYWDIEPYL